MNRLNGRDTAFTIEEDEPAQPSSARAGGPLVPFDPERYALELHIQQAKNRIAEDLNRASALVRGVVVRAGRGLGTVVLVSGLAIASVVVTALAWRSRRGARIRWR